MIHIYSGDGKGKTTAATGIAIRAAGAGMLVCFCQFLKNGTSSEIALLRSIDGIKVSCCEECNKFTFEMNDEERSAVLKRHNEMLSEAKNIIEKASADMIVLDEFFGAYNTGLLDRSCAEYLVLNCPENIELVLTGREPAQIFCEAADYHSEIRSIRHPYENGLPARRGIEY